MPLRLEADSSTKFLLWNDYKDYVSNQTFTKNGVVLSVRVARDASYYQLDALATRVSSLESKASGSSSLVSYASEAAAYLGGVEQGSQYMKGGVVSVVKNKYRPIYTFAQKNPVKMQRLTLHQQTVI